MKNPRDIEKVNNWNFIVPTYKVTNNGIEDGAPHVINLCRGNRNDDTAPRQTGLFTETLLQVALEYLQAVNVGELANRDTSLAITHIEDAILRLNKRQEDRKIRGVQATYNK